MNPEKYYLPPKEWTFSEFTKRYFAINKKCNFSETLNFDDLERFPEIIKIKKALYAISWNIKVGDPGAKAIAIEFVLSPVYFHYSGFIRENMARRIKSAKLNKSEANKIVYGVENVLLKYPLSYEFKVIKKLYEYSQGVI